MPVRPSNMDVVAKARYIPFKDINRTVGAVLRRQLIGNFLSPMILQHIAIDCKTAINTDDLGLRLGSEVDGSGEVSNLFFEDTTALATINTTPAEISAGDTLLYEPATPVVLPANTNILFGVIGSSEIGRIEGEICLVPEDVLNSRT